MKLAWLTDIHLNFLETDVRKQFYQQIVSTQCQVILISGDIAEAPCLVDMLTEMENQVKKPVYFILGNHDYYGGNVKEVREKIAFLSQKSKNVFWMPASGIQCLNRNTIVVGEDGWADGRLGDYQNSSVSLNDSRMITDLFHAKILGKQPLLAKMQQLADLDAFRLQENLIQAVKRHPKRIIILTHVPPFKEACLYGGVISGDDWLPFFSSKVMGDVLTNIANENPSIEFLVLCGHTHSEANYKPLLNLTVRVGKAEYYQTQLELIYLE